MASGRTPASYSYDQGFKSQYKKCENEDITSLSMANGISTVVEYKVASSLDPGFKSQHRQSEKE
jgi:hypothetical protein